MGLDVRTKLIIAALFSVLAIVYQNPVALGALLVLKIGVLILLRVPLNSFLDFRKLIYLYLILIFIQSLFIQSGEPLIKLGSFYLLTTDGLLFGLSIVLRFLVLVGSGLILINCNTGELLLALSRMRIPYEIVFMIQLGIRFIPVLAGELSNILNTIQLRGVDLRRVYKRKIIRVYIGIFTPLLYSILQKAEQLAILLELRGFRYHPTRTFYRSIQMKGIDYAVISLSLAVTGAFVFMVAILF